MLLRKIRALRNSRSSRKNVLLATLAIYLVYIVVWNGLKYSVQTELAENNNKHGYTRVLKLGNRTGYTGELAHNGGVASNGGVANNGELARNGGVASNGELARNGGVASNGGVANNGELARNGGVANNGELASNGGVANNGELARNGGVASNGRVASNGAVASNGRLAINDTVASNGAAASNGHSRNKSGETAIPKKPINGHDCDQWFEYSFEDNLKHILQYPRGEADRYMYKIAGNVTEPKTVRSDFPVIATAADSGYYAISQGLLYSVYEVLLPKYKNIKVVFYDMGLSDDQRKQLEKYCDICELRKLSYQDLPEHLRKLKTYTWKPVIVKTLLMEFGWVWWMDSSVRFLDNDLDRALKYSQDNSILFFTYDVVSAVAYHTDVQTMQYLGEDSCKFRHLGEIEATFVLFHFDHITNVVTDQWLFCALNEACMAPKGTENKLSCYVNDTRDGMCHRFDQAVLSILLRRLYHEKNDYPLVSNPFHIHEIVRGNQVSYFPELLHFNY